MSWWWAGMSPPQVSAHYLTRPGTSRPWAVGPTLVSGLWQSIYYAKNTIGAAAGSNRVTVTFSPATAYPDVRILEYSGIDPVNAVDLFARRQYGVHVHHR